MTMVKSKKFEEKKIDEEIVERTAPRGRIVYEAIYREGEHELERGTSALAWSGLAAGLSIGFSFLMEGVLRDYLPAAHWRPAVAKIGYSVGFLIVILGRQQLFTKNTLTVILPLLRCKRLTLFKNVVRLWLVVLSTNMIGAFAFAGLISHTDICSSGVRAQFALMGREELGGDFMTVLLRAVLAGWLVALMIWLLPFADAARVWVIMLLAYLIGIAHLPHIIAGTVPTFYSVLTGDASFGRWLTHFFLPVLIGNGVGGVAVVATVAHAEFVKEL